MIKGTLILTLAGLIAKVISAFYKVPLERLTGTVGLTYYQAVYPLYSILTAVALIGIPNSVSKLVAEELVKKEYNKAHQTFRIAFVMSALFGLLVSLVLFVFGHAIIEVGHFLDGTYYALAGLSVGPIFVATAGAVRGYMQGMHIMMPTAISQVIENISKVVVGIGLVLILTRLGYSIPVAVGGAALGVSIGFMLSTLFLAVVYLRKRKAIKENIENNDKEIRYSKKDILRSIGYIALPVTIASASYSVMLNIDNFTLPRLLTSPIVAEAVKVTEGTLILGIFGKVQTIVNVPLVISISLIISIVPSISAANVLHNKTELKNKIKEALEMAIKLGMPSAVGIFVLAEPVLNFLYREPEGTGYLRMYAISLIFMIVAQSVIGILQGLSRYYTALYIVIAAAFVKVAINIVLIQTVLAGYGALVGTIGFYMTITGLGVIVIKRQTEYRSHVFHGIFKPFVASLIMGAVTYGTYGAFYGSIHSNALATILSVGVGMAVYGVVMVLMKAFTRDEIMILPKHEKVLLWLDKHGFVRAD